MNTRLPMETFLVLVTIAWADGSLERVERTALLRAATECGLRAEDLERLERAIRERLPLEQVDVGPLSRWVRVLTYALASWFAALDGVVSTGEHETLVTLGDRLGLEPALRVRASAAANDIACLPGEGRPERYDFVKLEARLRERLPQLALEE